MVEAGWGRIVNISSSSTHSGQPFMAHYVAAKSAVNGLTKSLALEYGPSGITVNAVPPGFVDTPMLRSAERAATARRNRRGPHQAHTGAPGGQARGHRRRVRVLRSPRKPATSPDRSSASTAAATPEERQGCTTGTNSSSTGSGSTPRVGYRHHVISPHSEAVDRPRGVRGTRRRRPRGRRRARGVRRPDRGRGCSPPNGSRRSPGWPAVYKERRADMAALISAEIGAPISFAKRAQVAAAADDDLGVLRPRRPTTTGRRIVRGCTATTFGSSSNRSASSPRWCRGTCRSSSPSPRSSPALLAGCSVVLKPAPESVLDAQLLADLVAASRPSARSASTWCPATATSASVWSAIPAWTRSRSPVPRRPAARSRWPAPRG